MEKAIDPFDKIQVESAIAQKRRNIKAVKTAYKDTTKDITASGKVLTISACKELEASKTASQKAIKHTASAPDFTSEELAQAVEALLQKEQTANSPKVYASERERYDAIIDAILDGANLSPADQEFKIYYEDTMDENTRLYFENKIEYGQHKRQEIKRWN